MAHNQVLIGFLVLSGTLLLLAYMGILAFFPNTGGTINPMNYIPGVALVPLGSAVWYVMGRWEGEIR